MYIVTLEELHSSDNSWHATHRIFTSKDKTKDFLEMMIDCLLIERVRNVQIWDAEELSYETDVKVDICWE